MGRKKDISEEKYKMIQDMIKHFEKQQQRGEKIRSVNRKVAALLKVSEPTVCKIHKAMARGEKWQANRGKCGRKKLFDSFDKALVRRIVHSLFSQNIQLFAERLLQEWNQQNPQKQCGRTTILRCLKQLKFAYRTVGDNKNVIMEREDVVRLRHSFLRKINQFRADGWEIVYLDETWCNQNHTRVKKWVETETGKCGKLPPTGKGKRVIILHAGSQSGWITGCANVFQGKKDTQDYHNEMNSTHFSEWFTQSLLPALEGPSVVVMDLAPYHKERVPGTARPTSSTK